MFGLANILQWWCPYHKGEVLIDPHAFERGNSCKILVLYHKAKDKNFHTGFFLNFHLQASFHIAQCPATYTITRKTNHHYQLSMQSMITQHHYVEAANYKSQVPSVCCYNETLQVSNSSKKKRHLSIYNLPEEPRNSAPAHRLKGERNQVAFKVIITLAANRFFHTKHQK